MADLGAQPGYVRDDLPDRAHRVVQVPPHVDPQRPSRVPGRLDRAIGLGQGPPGQRQEPASGLVSRTARACRVNKATPSSRSSRAIRLDNACWVRKSAGRPAEMQFLGGRDERPDLREIEIHAPSLRRQLLVVNQARALLDRPA